MPPRRAMKERRRSLIRSTCVPGYASCRRWQAETNMRTAPELTAYNRGHALRARAVPTRRVNTQNGTSMPMQCPSKSCPSLPRQVGIANRSSSTNQPKPLYEICLPLQRQITDLFHRVNFRKYTNKHTVCSRGQTSRNKCTTKRK